MRDNSDQDHSRAAEPSAHGLLSRRGLLRAGVVGGLTLGSACLTGCSSTMITPAQGQEASASASSTARSNVRIQPAGAIQSIQGWPAPELSAGLGVNLHFSSPQQALDQVARVAGLGLRFVRMDLTWSAVERQRGHYDFSSYDPVIHALTSRGIRLLCILGYNNALYEMVPSPPSTAVGPHTDAVRQAFARFVSATVTHFKGRGIIWEIWNEPDNVRFWSPTPTPAGYVDLLKTAVPALRQADTSALVIAPALTGMSSQYPAAWTYLEKCFSLGLPGLVDAISVHPYRQDGPESVTADYRRLSALLARYAPKNKVNLPIIDSEWGYSGTWVSREQQAAYFVRLALMDQLNGLPISIWYDWQDDGKDPRQQEENFGLLTWNGQPKPAYVAAQTLIRELGGYRLNRRLTGGADYGLLFTRGTAKKQVLWTTGNAHPVTLNINASSVTITSLTGGQRTQPVVNGRTILNITGDPQYVTPGA